MITANEAKKLAQEGISPDSEKLENFFQWVSEKAKSGNFGGCYLGADDDNPYGFDEVFTNKEVDYLVSLGYKIVFDGSYNFPFYTVSWR